MAAGPEIGGEVAKVAPRRGWCALILPNAGHFGGGQPAQPFGLFLAPQISKGLIAELGLSIGIKDHIRR